jgi:hypothetical protein
MLQKEKPSLMIKIVNLAAKVNAYYDSLEESRGDIT